MTSVAETSPETSAGQARVPLLPPEPVSEPLPFPGREVRAVATPRLAVLIPAHNAAARLPRALRSVLTQSLEDLEVIVVDDASSDRTAEVVEEAAQRDPRVRLIRAARNQGPGGARNLALRAARAPWIAPLDSDDAFLPGRLRRLIERAERAGADLIADNLILRHDATGDFGRPMLPRTLLDRPRWIDAVAFLEGNLPVPGHPRVSYGFLKPLVRRAFLERHGLGYRDGLRFAEDFDFYLRCLLAGGRWLLVPDAGYAYSVRADSLTAQHGAADLARLRALDRQYAAGGPAGTAGSAFACALGAHLRTVEDRLVLRLFFTALKRRRFRRALRLALRSRRDFLLVSLSMAGALPQIGLRHLRHRTPTAGA